jgi:hypothetical protein
MVDEDDIRAIAMSLPGTSEEPGTAHFRTGGKGFVWPYLERVHPKQPRVEHRDVFAIRVAAEEVKRELVATEPDKFFTTDHYNGYPAVLVRLTAIELDELNELLREAHACAQPKKRSPQGR